MYIQRDKNERKKIDLKKKIERVGLVEGVATAVMWR